MCTCGNPKVKKIAKKKGPNQGRYYLICPNPQTCEDAFEWVEPKESDFDWKLAIKKMQAHKWNLSNNKQGKN